MHLGKTLFLTVALALPAAAQVPLSGNVFDGSGGPLLSGTVYFSTTSITVPAGETLTVQPGAILKLGVNHLITVGGTLDSVPGAPAVFTALTDDNFGGDTNGDGPSDGSAGYWAGIRSLGTGVVDLDDTVIGFSGGGGWSPIHGNGGVIRLRDCTIAFSGSQGINANSHDVELVVERTAILNSAGWAMENIPIEQLPNFSGNTASGNGGGDSIELAIVNLDRDTSLVADNLLGGTVTLPTGATIPAGTTLELGEGIAVKSLLNGLITVNGNLIATGSPSAPTIFTSIDDDAAYGDTRNDGATPVGPGAWSGIRFQTGSSVQLQDVVIRYPGGTGWAGLYASGGELDLRDSLIEFGLNSGFVANSFDTPMTIENTAFENNVGWAMTGVRIERVPEFSSNSATGNGAGDAIRLATVNLDRNTSITTDNLIGDTLVTSISSSISQGNELTLGAGVIVKNSPVSLWTVNGTLRATGTDGSPTVFTSIPDDAVGGDVANDGPTTGAPSDWAGIRVTGDGLVEADYCDLRFAGGGGWAAFFSNSGTMNLRHCSVVSSTGPGINFSGHETPCEVVACRFENNTGQAIANVPLSVLTGFDSNAGSGNLGGDYVRTSLAAVNTAVSIGPRNVINDSVVVPGSFSITAEGSLTLGAGLALKVDSSGLISVSGELNARGTAGAPVLISSFEDDTRGGDTNGDGPSFGAPGDWAGIRTVTAGLGNGTLDFENVLIRNGGGGGWMNLLIVGSGHTLRAVRSEASDTAGFRFTNCNGVNAVNCVAFENVSVGIEASGGTVDFTHVTVSGSPIGIRTLGSHGGEIRNSVAWGNTLDLSLVPSTGVTYTTASGVGAGLGNSDADPLFIDAASGDLRLGIGSPAVDAGDFVTGVVTQKDANEASRLLAPDGLGGLQADKGAYEQGRWTLSRSGSTAIGESMSFQVNGAPGLAVLGYSFVLGGVPVEPWGMLLIGPAPLFILDTTAVGANVVVNLGLQPNLIGIKLGVQALAIFGADPDQSQLTNLERLTIEPALP